jgi:uncharacterized membrane protein
MWDRHVGPPGYHPWWTVLGVILPLLLFAILIGLVVWAALRLTREGSLRTGGPEWAGAAQHGADAALEHLRYRYARGEVGRDEFFRMWRDLGAPGAVPPPAPPPAVTAEEPGS